MQTRWFRALGLLLITSSSSAFAQEAPPVAATEPPPQAPAAVGEGANAAPAAPIVPEAPAPAPASAPAASPIAQAAPNIALEVKAPQREVDPGPPTLFSGSRHALSAYGGVSVTGSSMKGRGVAYVGLEAALLFEHKLALGLGVNGLASRIAGPDNEFGEPQRLGFGYGGLVLRYSLVDKRPYYLTFGTLVGGGGLTYQRDDVNDRNYRNHDDDREWNGKHDTVFVVEPSIGGHLNITRWMRVGAQVSYRVVTGVDNVTEMRAKDLSGFAYGGNLQLGFF